MKKIAKLVLKDDLRPLMCGVYVTNEYIYGTDTFRLFRMSSKKLGNIKIDLEDGEFVFIERDIWEKLNGKTSTTITKDAVTIHGYCETKFTLREVDDIFFKKTLLKLTKEVVDTTENLKGWHNESPISITFLNECLEALNSFIALEDIKTKEKTKKRYVFRINKHKHDELKSACVITDTEISKDDFAIIIMPMPTEHV